MIDPIRILYHQCQEESWGFLEVTIIHSHAQKARSIHEHPVMRSVGIDHDTFKSNTMALSIHAQQNVEALPSNYTTYMNSFTRPNVKLDLVVAQHLNNQRTNCYAR